MNANRITSTLVEAAAERPRGDVEILRIDVRLTVLSAGLIFLLALVLGLWKYQQVRASPQHRAHPYVDIAHRAALLYSFAALLVAVFVRLSVWPVWVNLTASMVLVFFFVVAIGTYILHGWKQDTENQFVDPDLAMRIGMVALVIGEVGGFGVLLAGFIAGQF